MERINKKTLIYLLTKFNNIYCIRRPKGSAKVYLYNKLLAQDVAIFQPQRKRNFKDIRGAINYEI